MAKEDFDSYLMYVEIKRKAEKRFYLPRRKVLLPLVRDLEKIGKGKVDEVFISTPPRAGKTTLIIFLVTWLMGRDPDRTILYSSYTSIITNSFYTGVMEILTDKDTYGWSEVFDSKIVRTNAADTIIDLGRVKHYPTLTCRSLYGTLNGACDAELIIGDDLISGIEEALSKDRLMSAWSKVDNNLIPRGTGKARFLWIGTRWSVADPEGKREDLLVNEPNFKERKWIKHNIPALNKKDQSNFVYDYDKGFSTEFYRQRRASFEWNNDMASWSAQYMGEPIEREGALFLSDEMRYFNGKLPSEPDRVFMAVDPAWGGADFTSAPVFAQCGEDIYVVDCVFNSGEKTVTQPLITKKAEKWKVGTIQIEATKMTESYKDGIKYKCNIVTKPAPRNTNGKEGRIFDKAPDIRKMYFLESGKRDKEYSDFMQNLFSFRMVGKNKHDDAPDSLAMGASMFSYPRAEVFKRMF